MPFLQKGLPSSLDWLFAPVASVKASYFLSSKNIKCVNSVSLEKLSRPCGRERARWLWYIPPCILALERRLGAVPAKRQSPCSYSLISGWACDLLWLRNAAEVVMRPFEPRLQQTACVHWFSKNSAKVNKVRPNLPGSYSPRCPVASHVLLRIHRPTRSRAAGRLASDHE